MDVSGLNSWNLSGLCGLFDNGNINQGYATHSVIGGEGPSALGGESDSLCGKNDIGEPSAGVMRRMGMAEEPFRMMRMVFSSRILLSILTPQEPSLPSRVRKNVDLCMVDVVVTLGFVLALCGAGAIQAVVELGRGQRLQAMDIFRQRPSTAHVRAYEKNI